MKVFAKPPLVFLLIFLSLFLSLPSDVVAQNHANIEFKEFRKYPGIVCTLHRQTFMPEILTLSSQKKEFLSIELFNECKKEISKKQWAKQKETTILVFSMRITHTDNLVCKKVFPAISPVVYSISLFSLALSGKKDEFEKCLYEVENAPDLANPVPLPLEESRGIHLKDA